MPEHQIERYELTLYRNEAITFNSNVKAYLPVVFWTMPPASKSTTMPTPAAA